MGSIIIYMVSVIVYTGSNCNNPVQLHCCITNTDDQVLKGVNEKNYNLLIRKLQ